MLYFVDYIHKYVFIMAPKCGTTTIANYLGVKLNQQNDPKILKDNEFLKIIIYRDNVVDRFLSGFYEDLFNNFCYINVDITFYEYLKFIYECFKNKIPNVNNMNLVYHDKNIPIWFGNCSKRSLPITNNNGTFCSHIQSQKYAISKIIDTVKNNNNNDNIKIVNLNNLNRVINSDLKLNVKHKSMHNIDLYKITLGELKQKRIIVSSHVLDEDCKNMILEIYKEDIDFINELKELYCEL